MDAFNGRILVIEMTEAIQPYIDNAIQELKLMRIVVREKSGSANVPANISIDFIDCELGMLTTVGNNRVNIERGSMDGADLTSTAIIIRATKIAKDVKAKTSTKIEYSAGVEIDGTTWLNASSLVSKATVYTALAWDVTRDSVIRSVSDEFYGGKMVRGDGKFTSIVVQDATIAPEKPSVA